MLNDLFLERSCAFLINSVGVGCLAVSVLRFSKLLLIFVLFFVR